MTPAPPTKVLTTTERRRLRSAKSGIRRALEDIYVPGQRLEKEWGAPAALQMARLLGSLGPLGGDVPVQKASHKLDKRQAQVKELLDELAEQGGQRGLELDVHRAEVDGLAEGDEVA